MGKREVTPLHRGGRVGDDGGEVVGQDCGDDDGHGGVPAPPEEKGRGGPSSSSSLTSSLDGRRVSPLVLGLHGGGGAGSPLRWDLSLSLFPSVSAFLILAFHRFLNSWRSVTPFGLNFGHIFYPEYWLSCGKRRAQTALRGG